MQATARAGRDRRRHGFGWWRAAALALAAGAALAPRPGRAQMLSSYNLRFEPYGGAFFDGYRNDRGSGSPGWIGGIRFAYDLGLAATAPERAVRLVVDGGRAVVDDAGGATLADTLDIVFRDEWWLLSGGLEWDVLPGWTGVSLEARAGAAWRQAIITSPDSVPPGTPGTTQEPGSRSRPLLVVGATVYHHLSQTIQLRVRAEDDWMDPAGDAKHSPVLAAGLRFLFD